MGMIVVMVVGTAGAVHMVVAVIVVMAVERQRALGAGAKERAVFLGLGHLFGRTFAADMTVEADHPVGGGHDDVEIMAHHQDGAAKLGPDLFDPLIKGRRAGLIEPLGGLVENE